MVCTSLPALWQYPGGVTAPAGIFYALFTIWKTVVSIGFRKGLYDITR